MSMASTIVGAIEQRLPYQPLGGRGLIRVSRL
jgi:hypothetical protein